MHACGRVMHWWTQAHCQLDIVLMPVLEHHTVPQPGPEALLVRFRDNWILHVCELQLASEHSHLTATLGLGARGHTAGMVLKREHTI